MLEQHEAIGDKRVQEIPVLKSRKNMGHVVLPHGCKLWAINLADLNDIEQVEFKQSMIKQAELANEIHHQAIYKKGYFYGIAINKKNALRKFWKANPNFRSQ